MPARSGEILACGCGILGKSVLNPGNARNRVVHHHELRVFLRCFAGDRPIRFEPHDLSFVESVPLRNRSHEADYESYVPSGILKSSWVPKHETAIPALTVLVFKLEEGKGVDWSKLELALNNQSRQLRDALRGHHGDMHVLIVQTASISLVDEALEHRELLGERLMR